MGVLSIVDPTQELLIQALRDIPRNPVFASIDFRANGLYPNWGSIECQRNYVEACKKAEPLPIIPFSRQTFVFNSFNFYCNFSRYLYWFKTNPFGLYEK